MGQCNDAFGAIQVAAALAEAFGCQVNDLPLTLVLSWYEQKAVCILLSLLHLGIRNIYLGPTLPAFLSPAILEYLTNSLKSIPSPHRRMTWPRFSPEIPAVKRDLYAAPAYRSLFYCFPNLGKYVFLIPDFSWQ